MSASSTQKPARGVVTFTSRGHAALDQLAGALVAECDGSSAGIADLLERVMKDDIEELAESLSEVAQPAPARGAKYRVEETDELGPAPESPEDAARRRLSPRRALAGSNPEAPGISIRP